jgi:hypothetical protein
MKVHPVFHMVKLKKFKERDNKFAPRVTGPFKDEVAASSSEEWVVEKIVDQGVNDDKRKVLCKWKGYDDTENAWECYDYICKEFPDV